MVRTSSVGAVLLAGALLAGCAEKVESPAVGLSKIDPNLVCNAQRLEPDVNVTLIGSGFTPMPTKVLEGPTVLILPEVTLAMSQDLTGESATGTTIVFPGEPGQALSNNLFWTSANEMSVRVSEDPAVDLEPGLYDVTVTNPDGEQTVTSPQGLAVVAPPAIDSIAPEPTAVCIDQGPREIVLSGENFLGVAGVKPLVSMTIDGETAELTPDQVELGACTLIPGAYNAGQAVLCDEITATLGEGQLPPGAYSVVVTSPAPAACESLEGPPVLLVPAPVVTTIDPPSICLDQTDQVITVSGGNFAQISVGPHAGELPTVTITSDDGDTVRDYDPTLSGCDVPDGVDQSFGVELCDSIEITVPTDDLPPGDYTLTVTNPDPIGCQSADIIALHVSAPPKVTGVAPATVCSGGSILEITGTGFQDGASVELVCTDTTVDAVAVDVTSDTAVTATFGAGVTAGDNCDVVLTNPDGCEDRPLPHQTITGTDGPILFNVDPNVAYNGIDTKVSLYVTALEGDFTVTMWPDGDPDSAVTLDATLAPNKTTVIQATIPADTAPTPAGGPGYTIQVNDESGCLAIAADAVRVTETLVVSTGTVTPPFGQDSESNAITIHLDADPGATGIPRAFLNPPGDEPAILLQSVTVLDATTLTAVVPADTPEGTYDVVIVWPDGSVAVLDDAYSSVTSAPPIITVVSPQSVTAQSGQAITLSGTDFSGSTVSVRCLTALGTFVDLPTTEQTEVCAGTTCTQQATIDATTAGVGAACVVTTTNADGTYGQYSAIAVTNASLNLAASPVAALDMNTARRALVSAGMQASNAARFVYAIGGDDGSVANAMDTAEFAAVDIFGVMNPWVDAAEAMTTPRTFAGIATIGRYLYVIGGNDGTGSLATAERALILSPEEIPAITDVNLCLSGGSADCFGMAGLDDGLDAGVYSYRVSAVIADTDPVNLGGETLASDPLILRLRDVDDRKITVQLSWTAPVDSENVELSGISKYRIYRTPVDGSPGSDEVLLDEVDASMLSYIDDGSKPLGTATPLPQGSTSAWQAVPDLNFGREGVGATAAMDPADASTWYVYALQGHDAGVGRADYEFLPVAIAANGRQTVGGSWTVGSEQSNLARWSHGIWKVDDSVLSEVSSGQTYVYVGAGSTSPTVENDMVEVTTVSVGGQLTAFDDSVDDLGPGNPAAGYGAPAIGSSTQARLFAFGGIETAPITTIRSAGIDNVPDIINWNAEGGRALTVPRAYMGMALQSANIFLIGGTSTGTNALASTEQVVW